MQDWYKQRTKENEGQTNNPVNWNESFKRDMSAKLK